MNFKLIGSALFVLLLAFIGYYALNGQGIGDNLQAKLAETEAETMEKLDSIGEATAREDIVLAQASFKPENLPLALHIQDNDRIIGDPNAPVTVIEYASMTCSHCADFHNNVYPKIRTDYIDTGKVKWVQRALPWDDAAVYISKINRCVPPEQFEAVSGAYFKAQEQWIKSDNPLGEVKKIARLAGISAEKFDACTADAALTKEVLAMKRVATEVLRVRGTPAFFINGERVEGGRNYRFMKKAFDTAYEAATQAQG